MGVLVAAGGPMLGVDPVSRYLARGLVSMSFILVCGEVSGAHFNPAATLGFAWRGVFPWRRVPAYIISQIVAGIMAASLLQAVLGRADRMASPLPLGVMPAFWMEIVLTFGLLMVIHGTGSEHKITGHNAALAVGGYTTAAGLFGGSVSGASMNPARSLGPALLAGDYRTLWMYLVAPCIGAALATVCTWLLQGQPHHEEKKAAVGDRNAAEQPSAPAGIGT
jgi:aquaporin Z